MLRTDDCILKPLNFQEWIFYENLWEFVGDPRLSLEPDFFPASRGRVVVNQNEWLMLENLCVSMKNPSILDLKVGASSKGHTKSGAVKKIKQTVVKAMSTSSTLGFRVAGMKVWKGGHYDEKPKKYGVTLGASQMPNCLSEYFTPSQEQGFRIDFAQFVLEKLVRIQQWMRKQDRFSFNSSSILMLYDSDTNVCDVRMIDFAHCYCLTFDPTGEWHFLGVHEKNPQQPPPAPSSSSTSGDGFLDAIGGLSLASSLNLVGPKEEALAVQEAPVRKKSAQMQKLQGSQDALLNQGAPPKVDLAYVQALDNLISIIGDLIAAHKK